MVIRTFGHCFVRWKINNFCVEVFHEKCTIRSPEFIVKIPETTEWEMGLDTLPGEDSVFFQLKRLNSGPQIVWVNWTIDFRDFTGQTIVDYECERYFERRQKHVVDLESVREIADTLFNNEMDSIEIACRIIVKLESSGAETDPKEHIDTGLSSLSQDLRRLFKRGKYYDVVIRVGEKDIRAHKSVLTRRNDSLGKMILNKKVVPLSGINAEAVETVITYLYTGNLECILRNPSIDLYECIDYFEVDELKPYVLPDNINMSSNIQVEEDCFRMMVPHFRWENNVVNTGELVGNDSRTTWRLHIFPYGYDFRSNFICVQVELMAVGDIEVACMELAVLDIRDVAVNKVKAFGYLVAGEYFAFDQFLNRSSLDDILKNDQFRIFITIRASRRTQNSSIVSKQNTSQNEFRTLPHYLTLSAAMKSMFHGLLYKDVILKAKEGNCFHAHRCILAARSKYFAKLLADPSGEISVEMEASILKALLQYMYSGVLEDLQITELFQLYKVAGEYGIYALKFDCCRFLQLQLNVKNMHEILAFADEYQESELKLNSQRFIDTYRNHTSDDAI